RVEGEAGRRGSHRGVRGARPQRRDAPRPRRPEDPRAALSPRSAPGGRVARDRRRVLSARARVARSVRVTHAAEQVEVSADPREQYERAIVERRSDGVPLLPATDDAVEALLAATPYPGDHALCVLPPSNGVATVELIAINAAMAGVEPAAFPVVIAALEAISEPEWNAFGLTTTTSSVFPMLLVNA